MNVCYISSDAFAPYLGTSLFSLLDTNKSVKTIVIYIYSVDISDENKNKILSIANKFRRKIVFLENKKIEELAKAYHFSSFGGMFSTYAKILPSMYLKQLDKVLILDSDTIITQNLSELYNVDLNNAYLAAVPELTAYYHSSEDKTIIHKNQFYYNSGVLLWNISKVNEDRFDQRILNTFKNYEGKLKLADQSLLNLTLRDTDVIPLNLKYNFNNNLNHIFSDLRPEILKKYELAGLGIPGVDYTKVIPGNAIAVIHFLGAHRPWLKWCFPPLKRYFMKYWKRGPWKNEFRESYLSQVKERIAKNNPNHLVRKKYIGTVYTATLIIAERYFPSVLKAIKIIRAKNDMKSDFPPPWMTRAFSAPNRLYSRWGRPVMQQCGGVFALKSLTFMKIKPVSEAVFQQEVSVQRKETQKLYKMQQGIYEQLQDQNQLKGQLKNLQKGFVELQKKDEELLRKVNTLLSTVLVLRQNEQLVDVRLERRYYSQFPYEVTEKAPDFKDKFLNLIHGLDKDSIDTVVLALTRLKQIQESPFPQMPLYNAREKELMREIKSTLFNQVLKISENCYYYNGYMLPSNSFEACVFFDKCGIHYLEHPEKILKCDIIDAGAFIGDSALILSDFTEQNVYAFEPVPYNYERMLSTIKMNQKTNIVPCQYALGAEKGSVILSLHNSCSTQFENQAFEYDEKIEVNVITVDEFVEKHDLHIGLIKTDVEGAEQLLLRGAMKTIKKQKPALIISIYHNADDFFHIKTMLENLELNYRFKIRHPIGGTILTETILVAEI